MKTIDDLVTTFVQHLRAGGRAASTVTWSEQRLGQFARWLTLPIARVGVETLDAYAASLFERELSPHTVYGHRKLLRQFFRWCCRRGHLKANPAENWQVSRPRSPDAESKSVRLEEVIALVEACERSQPPRDVRDDAIVRTLYATGMRAGELIHLRLRDVRWHNRRCVLFIRDTHAKGRKHRRAYPDPSTDQSIRSWLEVRPPSADDVLFLGANGSDWTALTYSGLRQVLRRLCQRAGVAASLHGFRHGFAIQFLENGGNLSELSDLLGHADVRTTKEFYGTYETDRLARAAERHSPGAALAQHIEDEKARQLWFPEVAPDHRTLCPVVGSPRASRDNGQ